MKKEDTKKFNRLVLLSIVLVVFIFNYISTVFYSIKLNWNNTSEAFIFGRSVTKPLMFFVWIFATSIILELKKLFPYSNTRKKNILIHVFFSIVLTTVISFLSEVLTMGLIYTFDETHYQEYKQNYFGNLGMHLVNIQIVGVVIYWLIIIYLTSMDYYERYKNESLKRAEAESLITKAELSALKMQIQPHFLFNTLHSISSLIDINKEEAQDVIGRLGDLLRYTLDQHKNDFITLKTELDFIENYLEIEKARFKDRLKIILDIDRGTEEIYIASFILQPLIENAIKHGFSKTNRECTITISSEIVDENLKLEVTDNGNGSEIIKKGIGLENTEQRLNNHYNNNYKFSYCNTVPTGFQVVINVPIILEKDLVSN